MCLPRFFLRVRHLFDLHVRLFMFLSHNPMKEVEEGLGMVTEGHDSDDGSASMSSPVLSKGNASSDNACIKELEAICEVRDQKIEEVSFKQFRPSASNHLSIAHLLVDVYSAYSLL